MTISRSLAILLLSGISLAACVSSDGDTDNDPPDQDAGGGSGDGGSGDGSSDGGSGDGSSDGGSGDGSGDGGSGDGSGDGGSGDGSGDGGSGDGGGTTPPPDDSLDETTDPAVDVRVIAINNSGDLVTIVAGTFDGATDSVGFSVDGDSFELALDSASALNDGRFYTAALEDGSSFRLVYVPTDFSAIPTSGQSVFDGAASILVTLTDAGDATGTYNGIMDALIVADFDDPTGSSLTLDHLADATFSSAADPTAGATTYTPTDTEMVSITGLQDTQTGLVSGTETAAILADFGEDGITAEATANQIELEAGFAGPDASEIAGGVRIDGDTAVVRIEFTGGR